MRSALAALDELVSDIAVDRVRSGMLNPADAVLTAVAGLPALQLDGSGVLQFQTALRLVGQAPPRTVVELALRAFADPLALAVMEDPPRFD
ncbi:MAG: hypothetical protein O3C27_17735, partial [Actinomycetota bacterium]|nr:hypothetical protein [Actinomycetota bacterium]